MSRFYYTSKRKDKTSQDTHASNMIKDIIIMLGIYSTYNNHNNI